jgi:hypothetical protein
MTEDDRAVTNQVPDNPGGRDDRDVTAEVVELAEHYVGFAAKDYLDRQCRIHLDKPLDTVTADDLEDLARWVKNTAPLVMNEEDGKELAEQIAALADE